MCLVLHSAVEVQPFPLIRVPGQTHLGTGGWFWSGSKHCMRSRQGWAEGGRGVIAPSETCHWKQGRDPLLTSGQGHHRIYSTCKSTRPPPLAAIPAGLCHFAEVAAALLHGPEHRHHTQGAVRGLSCDSTRSKCTSLKVSVYSTGLGRGRDSFSPFWNCCKT